MILAIETSCDETCASVVGADLHILSNVTNTQIDIHKLYGGVVPEIASRNHAMNILGVVEEALSRAKITKSDLTAIAATTHPGLRGCVMVGAVFGESAAAALKIPFIPVNHLAAHIASISLSGAFPPAPPLRRPNESNFPFLCLLVSGGHTALYHVKSWDNIHLLTQTIDDAVGEAFDKVGKILGLEYPAGPKIETLALQNTAPLITFVKNNKCKQFTYSGLKTSVLHYKDKTNIPNICASFQHEAVSQLVTRTREWQRKLGVNTVCVCGGVSANKYLRAQLPDAIFPPFEYCTDNAAMVGAAAILGVKIVDEK